MTIRANSGTTKFYIYNSQFINNLAVGLLEGKGGAINVDYLSDF